MENLHRFSEMNSESQSIIVLAHSALVEEDLTRLDDLNRIFHLGNPNVVIGKNDGTAYCRIAEDSKAVMVLLCKNYL
jgi:hypothetical protein